MYINRKTNFTMDEYAVIEKYEEAKQDWRAMSQAMRQPFYQAMKVFKFVHGYGQKSTMQHDKELCAIWEGIKKQVLREFMIFDKEDIDPEKLGDMNLRAIELIKERWPY